MTSLVVDTSIISFLLKGHSLAQDYWERFLRRHLLAVSFMSVAELYRWPLLRGWGEKRTSDLLEHLAGYVVLPYDNAMSWEWARIMSRKGRPISTADAWIAATALAHHAPLVTHNPRHFSGIEGLKVLSLGPTN